jgi:2-methylcitrate dehydratase PrpD
MSKQQSGVNRRGFLKSAATAAGAARVAPAVLAAAAPAVVSATEAAQAAQAAPAAASGYTPKLAEYAVKLRYEDIPPQVLQRAKDCICDTVGTIVYGAELPWSKIIVAYAKRVGSGGKSHILGSGDAPVHAPAAALAHGALTHAFELDNLTAPDSGVHPGATMLSSGLAVAQERGLSGKELLTAFVAGAEVAIRIGNATKHTNEVRGFHAPGTTGPFAAAVACGHLMKFDAEKMTNALGIAGSCAGGLLEFAHSGTGAMVKRLHLGRAAESGVLASSLAAEGFTGPSTVIEGGAGFLHDFCTEWDLAALTDGLGERYVTLNILMKRYACHITAHNPVEAVRDLQAANKFSPEDIAAIAIAGNKRMATVNNIAAPADMMMAQFGIPFCVALAFYRNPVDPRSFDESAVHDPKILALAQRVTMMAVEGQDNRNMATTVTVTLKDGRTPSQDVTAFMGTPERPLDRAGLLEKYMLLTKEHPREAMERIFDRLQNIEAEPNLAWLRV